MRIVTYDLETFWSSKDYTMSKMGIIEYARDPRYNTQLVGVSVNGQLAEVYEGVALPRVFSSFDLENDVFVAHNGAAFDHVILFEQYGIRPKNLWDTIFMARFTGLASISSESHKALTALLGNGEKQAGTVVSDGKRWPQDFTGDEQAFFMRYCGDDVNQCAKNMRCMLPYMTSDALKFMSITARMATEPVFVFDEALLTEFIKQLDAEAEEARQKIMGLFHFDSLPEFFKAIRSAAKFATMLQELGVEPPVKLSEAKSKTAGYPVYTYAFAKSDIEFLALREHSDPRVRLLVETRLAMNSSILRTRAETLLKFAKHKKPIPIVLSAFKARTGRYSAGASEGKTDAIQFQNLSKRNPAHLPLRRAIKAPAGYKVVAVDSSQVEARVLAYEANHYELLDHFRQGRDPYAELAINFDKQYTAQQIHDGAKSGDKHCKQLRNVAKTLILACGFGTSAQKFSDTLIRQGMKLADTPQQHFVIAYKYHSIYRASNAPVVQFWCTCQTILDALVIGGSGQFGGPDSNLFTYGVFPIVGQQDLAVPSIGLPNGYYLRYPNLRMQENDNGKIEYVYDVYKGKSIIPTRIFNTKLAENLTQSLAFAILIWQACRMDEDGISLKGNNHDCWYTVVPEEQAQNTLDKMLWHMKQVPSWAAGCPIDCDGELGTDFTVC